ncbi:hypothetical protein [Streptomyces sp. NPDC048623]|uniref:hypothetical protein n=1 Tax=Streptomyces sp. NPDC048623 TaxID=3155761 RepID=UPI00343DF775
MSETVRARGGVERLLLLAALLLGLVTMHTLGHEPGAGHTAAAMTGVTHAVGDGRSHGAAHGPARTAAHAVGHGQGHNPAHGPALGLAGTATHAAADAGRAGAGRHLAPHSPTTPAQAPAHQSGGPLAVCLAVLGTFAVVLGGLALLRMRRRGGHAAGRTSGVRRPAWPQAPPPGLAVLDRVAVLRI